MYVRAIAGVSQSVCQPFKWDVDRQGLRRALRTHHAAGDGGEEERRGQDEAAEHGCVVGGWWCLPWGVGVCGTTGRDQCGGVVWGRVKGGVNLGCGRLKAESTQIVQRRAPAIQLVDSRASIAIQVYHSGHVDRRKTFPVVVH